MDLTHTHDRDLRYDYLRALAIIMVVFIHSTALFRQYAIQHAGVNLEFIAYAIVNIIFTAVPLFVMLSGALLLRKDEPIAEFYRKRFSRVVIPFVVWSIIVYAITYLMEGGRSLTGYLYGLYFKTVFESGVHDIYWYIYIILGLYLLTPILRLICQKADKQMMYYLFFLSLALYCANQLIPGVTLFQRFDCKILQYLMYFVAGYVITNYACREKYFKLVSIVGFVIGWGLLIGQFILFQSNTDYLEISRLVACLSLFALFFCDSKPIRKTKLTPVITTISDYSYGIYLCHFLFLSFIVRLPHFTELPVLIEFPLLGVLTLLTTCTALFLAKKLRIAKYIM